MSHNNTISFLKSKINELMGRVTEINTQIGPLLSEKEELELIALEIEGSIKVLGLSNDQQA